MSDRSPCRTSSVLLAVLAAGLSWLFAVPARNLAKPIDVKMASIDEVRAIADRIQIDGRADDWEGIPSFLDPADDTGGDDTRDFVRVAIAPREKDLLVLLMTKGKPSTVSYAFGVDIDIAGTSLSECRLNFANKHAPELYLHGDRGTSGPKQEFKGLQLAVDEVVEARIPYEDLARHLPPEIANKLTGADARSWVRIYPFAWDYKKKAYADFGPAVASFRLIGELFALDPPLPHKAEKFLSVELPVDGQWFICQGPFGKLGHEDSWAFDLIQADPCLQFSRVTGSKRVEDHLSWGKTVFAPIAGKVILRRSDVADKVNGPDDFAKLREQGAVGNEVGLDIGNDLGLRFCHFMQDSVVPGLDDDVAPGQFLGKVGSSGMCTSPHLHMDLYQLPDFRVSLPLGLSKVRVSLNPVPNDPWQRELHTWLPREGFFVERWKQ